MRIACLADLHGHLPARLRTVVTGHIHEAHGRYRLGGSTVVNAAVLAGEYEPTWPIAVVELDEEGSVRA